MLDDYCISSQSQGQKLSITKIGPSEMIELEEASLFLRNSIQTFLLKPKKLVLQKFVLDFIEDHAGIMYVTNFKVFSQEFCSN